MAGVDTVPAPTLSVMTDKVDIDGGYAASADIIINVKFDIEVTVPTVGAGTRDGTDGQRSRCFQD